MEEIRLKARAKINLTLDVTGKRDNGYHELQMIMQTVGLYDEIVLRKIPENEIRLESLTVCAGERCWQKAWVKC